MSISGDIIDMSDKDDKFFDNIITEYETLCFLYEPQKYGNLLNGKRHHHHKAKYLDSIGVNGNLCRNFFTARTLSIMSSSLRVKLNKKCILTYLSPYGRGQKETPRKMENQQFVSLSRKCSSTPVGFGLRFLSKEKCDNTGASPIIS